MREAEKQVGGTKQQAVELSSEEEVEVTISVFLQGPSGKFKLAVRPTATMRKMVAVYRAHGKVPLDKKISIELDGEIQGDAVTVKEAGLEDGDLLDVIIEDM